MTSEPLDIEDDFVVDYEDDETGILDALPWDHHELDDFVNKENLIEGGNE